ncbi:MAG: 4Fe-4S cluster-binding domain-containing protein, partial [Candidatus Omnitrophica bacterium]|nr:4Fe-4S cluster-binding domain-containing protein [Candidatus Omnitrophota bacterium]
MPAGAQGIHISLPPAGQSPLKIHLHYKDEPRCNFNCCFCFNKNSFAKQDRNIKTFTTSQVKKIINAIAQAKVKIVRFTGGEPLLR